MTDKRQCDTEASTAPGRAPCPVCGAPGPTVDHRTVAALVSSPVPPRQGFRLCRSVGCPTVYHGEAGAAFVVDELHVVPGFKSSGDRLVCYCFLHTREQLAAEIASEGATTIPDRIRARIEAGDCACEVRNPSGRCCLGEVDRTVARIRAELAAGDVT